VSPAAVQESMTIGQPGHYTAWEPSGKQVSMKICLSISLTEGVYRMGELAEGTFDIYFCQQCAMACAFNKING